MFRARILKEIFKAVRKEEIKKHYRNHKTRRDEYLLSKANLESEAGDEEKAKAIRNIKKAERRNQCYRNFKFHTGTGISSQEINRIQIPKSWKSMQEYKVDDEFEWIDETLRSMKKLSNNVTTMHYVVAFQGQ